jgi:hypothetical protein
MLEAAASFPPCRSNHRALPDWWQRVARSHTASDLGSNYPSLSERCNDADEFQRIFGREVPGSFLVCHARAAEASESPSPSDGRRPRGDRQLRRKSADPLDKRRGVAQEPRLQLIPIEVDRDQELTRVNRRPPKHAQDDSSAVVLNRLTAEERRICEWRRLGFSSRQIARHHRNSVATVDALYRQAMGKIRRLLK